VIRVKCHHRKGFSRNARDKGDQKTISPLIVQGIFREDGSRTGRTLLCGHDFHGPPAEGIYLKVVLSAARMER